MGKIKTSSTVSFIMVCVLALFMLIPLFMVQDLVRERKYTKEEARRDISQKWGGKDLIYGPILKVPYGGKYAYFFPEKLNVDAEIKTQTKRRNNYQTAVFITDAKIDGSFSNMEYDREIKYQWEKSKLLFLTSGLKGIKEVEVKIGGEKNKFESYTLQEKYLNENVIKDITIEGLESKEFLFDPQKSDFEISVKKNASQSFAVMPIGRKTTARVKSDWKEPSFMGEFLPQDKKITKEGFEAKWEVLSLNRAFAQHYYGAELPKTEAAFEVDFFVSVDGYAQNERAVKYGAMVISLTFVLFFLIQALSGEQIHIFKYTMIGLSLVVFYALLLSITEHTTFNTAYLISSAMTITLISLYSKAILEEKKTPYAIGIALTALYLFIYLIIQMEDYALLVGSLGLFAIISAIMYFSRNLWREKR